MGIDVPSARLQVFLTYKMAQIIDPLFVTMSEQITDVKKMDAPLEKIVMLWGKENLLGSVVENLLGSLKMWRIVRIADDHDKCAIVKDIKDHKPAALIVYKKEELVDVQLLIRLFDECPGLKIITVSPESNSVQIYNKQRVWIKSSEDFLSMMDE